MFFVIHICLRLLCSSYQHLKLMSNPNFITLILYQNFVTNNMRLELNSPLQQQWQQLRESTKTNQLQVVNDSQNVSNTLQHLEVIIINSEYEQIVKYFKVSHCVMVLFKNIVPTSFKDCFLKCDYQYTISSIMIDEDTRHHLQSIHFEINCFTPPTQKVRQSSK